MSQSNRRGFIRSLLVAGVVAGPAHASIAAGLAWPFSESDLPSAPPSLEHGSQQLRISPVGSPLRIGNEWKPATLPNNPFIVGESFPLVTTRVQREDSRIHCAGEGKAEGADGKALSYRWDSEISAVRPFEDAPWFRLRTTLHLPAPVKLREDSRIEPQVITWLSSSSTLMEGQSGS